MKIKIVMTINTDNTADEDEKEARIILTEMTKKLNIGDYPTVLRDKNGHVVGFIEYQHSQP